MTATELISLISRWAFVLIAAVTLLDYGRYRSRARLDIALMFSALAFVVLGSELQQALGTGAAWFGALIFLSLLAQPYLLLRLVRHFRVLSARVGRLALVGLIICGLILLIPLTAMPRPLLLVMLLYFVVVEGYATWLFVNISRQSRGVMRWRTRFAAMGSGWLAAAILMLAVPVVMPTASALFGTLLNVFALLSVVSYFLGFATPVPLRRAWQLAELHDFLRQSAGRPIAERLDGTLSYLCPAVTRTVGGIASGIFLWDPATLRVNLKATDWPAAWQMVPLDPAVEPLAPVWHYQRSIHVETVSGISPEVAGLAARLKAGALLAAPIAGAERPWGVLLVFRASPSLFPGDDQDVLRLFAHQATELLESGELFNRQKQLVAQLEVANKDLEAFSYSVSHDLRAPLRAMSGFSQVLMEDHLPELSDQAQHYVRRIQSNAANMGLLVDDLLAFSRFGRQPLVLQSIDPGRVASQAWEDLRHEHEGRPVELELGSLPPCQADPGLLKQVYINLLSNALKFTRQQTPARITVGCRDDGTGVSYFVRDNGVGFDMAYASKLFGVFQRLHRVEDFEGTGVGLAIVHRIVERHGGAITAESAVGHGATFYFTLKESQSP